MQQWSYTYQLLLQKVQVAEKNNLCTPGDLARDRDDLFAPVAPELLVAVVLKLIDAAAEIPSSWEYTCSKIYEL